MEKINQMSERAIKIRDKLIKNAPYEILEILLNDAEAEYTLNAACQAAAEWE